MSVYLSSSSPTSYNKQTPIRKVTSHIHDATIVHQASTAPSKMMLGISLCVSGKFLFLVTVDFVILNGVLHIIDSFLDSS